jgi:L-malate glycosyltransferase
MKILHCVESYYPALGGMQEVVKQLSERLVRLGHSVTIATRKHPERTLTFVEGVLIVDFEISGNLVNGIKGDRKAYEKFLLESNFDIVTFFAAQQWATDVALPILKLIKGKKVSVPTGYSGLYWTDYKGYFNQMKEWIHDYDMNVYLSNDYRDINFARENGVTKTIIIPNGAGEDEFLSSSKINVRKLLNLSDDTFLILHVGSYTGWKGHHEAMEIFLRAGLKKSALLMIGNNSEQFAISKIKNPLLFLLKKLNDLKGKKNIFFDYYSREFTVQAYHQSDLFLFPSNIECSPIVLFECAAAQLPFLSTDVGNSVEISQWTKGGVILHTKKTEDGFSKVDIATSVSKLRDMYLDENLRRKMGSESFTIWKENFSWEKITERYEGLYKRLIA